VKSYKLGMKNPNFTQIGCVNCEVWKRQFNLIWNQYFDPKWGQN
jgi:hypothetical protein